MKILLTGGSSFLGKKTLSLISDSFNVIGTFNSKRSEKLIHLDLSDIAQISKIFNEILPDVVLHLASITDLSICENNQEMAKIVNSIATLELARMCDLNNARMIYISSDYVFSGNDGPYDEHAKPGPLSYYGQSKLGGEEILSILNNSVVCRIPILYGFNDQDDKETFVSQVLRKTDNKEKFRVDNHRIKYPVLIDDVAIFIKTLVESTETGIFHLSSKLPLTRYDWALKIAETFDIPATLIKKDDELEKDAFPPKPVDVDLLNTRHDFVFRSVDEGLRIIKEQMGNKSHLN
ncbi:MAG: SDR family oxidoreductase [Candidatus Marinimicrobia bacterium]|nr:SDR family oxidoreductase [Candidatus Neomarinimicrobiota bacterium]